MHDEPVGFGLEGSIACLLAAMSEIMNKRSLIFIELRHCIGWRERTVGMFMLDMNVHPHHPAG